MPQEQVHAKPARRIVKPSEQEMEQLASDDTRPASEHVTVDDIDDLLDEIDAVLEENANEVLQAYRQKGGE